MLYSCGMPHTQGIPFSRHECRRSPSRADPPAADAVHGADSSTVEGSASWTTPPRATSDTDGPRLDSSRSHSSHLRRPMPGAVPSAPRRERAAVQPGAAGLAVGRLTPQLLRPGVLAAARPAQRERAHPARRPARDPDPDPVHQSLPRRRHRGLGLGRERQRQPGRLQGRPPHGPADRPLPPGRARAEPAAPAGRQHHGLLQHPRPRRALHRPAAAGDRRVRRQPARRALLAHRASSSASSFPTAPSAGRTTGSPARR